jgi:succinyl-CoA synthetase beta subunit
MTLTHVGGMDIEELDKSLIAQVPFEALTGLKAFVVANALTDIGAPKEIISPLVQHLPKLWELFHDYGITTLELNPIRMRPDRSGRLTPVACDFKCGFDRDDPRWQRLDLPDHLFTADASDFEQEVNQLRTHQGQSDVFVINPEGTILAPTFGGGANSLVTQVLGDDAIISSDFGGNPPYEKMKEVARICYKHWLKQANVLFIIGGKSNNTDIYETFRAMGELREHFSTTVPPRFMLWWDVAGPISSAAWAHWPRPATRSISPTASSVLTALSRKSSTTPRASMNG